MDGWNYLMSANRQHYFAGATSLCGQWEIHPRLIRFNDPEPYKDLDLCERCLSKFNEAKHSSSAPVSGLRLRPLN